MKLRHRIATVVASLCLLALTSSAQSGEDRRVIVVNRASTAIRYLYASNVDRNTWEEDLLGPFNVVLPDHYQVFNMDDGTGHCLYDLKAILYDGREAIRSRFNVCTGESWTITNGD